jgi:hypothetical protein
MLAFERLFRFDYPPIIGESKLLAWILRSTVALSLLTIILISIQNAPEAAAITGNASPASGLAARTIVILVDEREDLCTATALAPDIVLTATHGVIGLHRRTVNRRREQLLTGRHRGRPTAHRSRNTRVI